MLCRKAVKRKESMSGTLCAASEKVVITPVPERPNLAASLLFDVQRQSPAVFAVKVPQSLWFKRQIMTALTNIWGCRHPGNYHSQRSVLHFRTASCKAPSGHSTTGGHSAGPVRDQKLVLTAPASGDKNAAFGMNASADCPVPFQRVWH